MNIKQESEILEASMKILQQARFATVTFNQTAFNFLLRIERRLNDQFKSDFEGAFKTDEVLEAETVEVS